MTHRDEIDLAFAQEVIGCARCGELLAKCARSGLRQPRRHGGITFEGADVAMLDALHGEGPSKTDRTCPDCMRQVLLRGASGRSELELAPGALGPRRSACAACAPVVDAIATAPRSYVVAVSGAGSVMLPGSFRTIVSERFVTMRDEGRCAECGRHARFLPPDAPWGLSLGWSPDRDAAPGHIPELGCASCSAFVRSRILDAKIEGSSIRVEGATLEAHGAIRGDEASGRCETCGRHLHLVEEPRSGGWYVAVPIGSSGAV